MLEMAFCDDFSFIWSAKVLAETGHVTYNGWESPMLGWQLYLGALFIKLFGFSFTTVHASMLPIGMFTAALLQRTYVRLGISEWNSTFATLTVVLSPLFLPLSFSFMSDVPGVLAIVLCIYLCLRALQAETEAASLGWLAFAALTNVVGGTVRQITWLGVLVIIPSTVWQLRHAKKVVITGISLWLVSAGALAIMVHWFKAQPYALQDKLFLPPTGINICLILFYALPVTVAFLPTLPSERGSAFPWLKKLIAGSVLCALAMGVRAYFIAPFSGDWVTAVGLNVPSLLGERPVVLKPALRIILTICTFAASTAFLVSLAGSRSEKLPRANEEYVTTKSFVILLGPFMAAYLFTLVTRPFAFDRYYLPIIIVFLAVVLRQYERVVGPRLPWICVAVLTVFTVFSVMTTHDLIATQRARLGAANELRAAGIARIHIDAGFEYDGWTQLEAAGYINDSRIVEPKGAFRPAAPGTLKCRSWFAKRAPAIEAEYELSYEPISCLRPSEFAPVQFRTWLPPWRREIFISRVPQLSGH